MSTLIPPHAVILSLRNWLGASRLPKAFQRAGWEVSTLSFPSLLLDRCRSTSAQFFLPDRGSEEDLVAAARQALVAIRPTIVIPGDEAATELLQAVAATACLELPESDPLLVLLRDSLGDPHFNDAFHDVPWEDPDLVEALVILARGQMRSGKWYLQEARRERMRQLLTRIEVPDVRRGTGRGA